MKNLLMLLSLLSVPLSFACGERFANVEREPHPSEIAEWIKVGYAEGVTHAAQEYANRGEAGLQWIVNAHGEEPVAVSAPSPMDRPLEDVSMVYDAESGEWQVPDGSGGWKVAENDSDFPHGIKPLPPPPLPNMSK